MGNAMLDRLRAAEQRGAEAGEQFGEQLAIDLMQIALHRQGWGYERIRRLLDEMKALSDYYDLAFRPNDELEIWQHRMDNEIEDMIRGRTRFYTFEERSPLVPRLKWKRQRNIVPIEWEGDGNG